MRTVSSKAGLRIRGGRSRTERFLLVRAAQKRKKRNEAFKHWLANRKEGK